MVIKFSFKEKKLIVKVDNNLAGYIVYNYPKATERRNIEIQHVFVYKKYRRQGIAKKMLDYFIKHFNKSVCWIFLWTGEMLEEDRAFSVYRKAGFKNKTFLKEFYKHKVGTHLFCYKGKLCK
jgi:ribosomal protein S18 acetylase RimI-like enzyme